MYYTHEGRMESVVEELATRMVERDYHVKVLNRRGKQVSGGEPKMVSKYKGVQAK